MQVLRHGLAFNDLGVFRTIFLLQCHQPLLRHVQLFEQGTEQGVRGGGRDGLGEAFRAEVLPQTLEAVQQGYLPDILGFAFNAQAFQLAQRIRRHQGRRAISARHRIRDIQFDAQVVHVLSGLS